MESKLQRKRKIKIIIILFLLCACIYMFFINQVSAESLLNDINAEKMLIKIGIKGNVKVLNQEEGIDLTVKETKNTEEILQAENLELEELEDTYIVTGNIDSHVFNSGLEDSVIIRYVFDKKTKDFIESTIEVSDKLDEEITNVVIEEVSSINNLSESQATNIVDVQTDTSIKIVPTEEEHREFIEQELKEKLEVLNKIEIDNSLKRVIINGKSYTLGSSTYNSAVQQEKVEDENALTILTQDIIEDDILYHTIDSVIYGIAGETNKINYLSEDEIIEKLGEPTRLGKSLYWNISIGNEEINIVLTDMTIEILYKNYI